MRNEVRFKYLLKMVPFFMHVSVILIVLRYLYTPCFFECENAEMRTQSQFYEEQKFCMQCVNVRLYF